MCHRVVQQKGKSCLNLREWGNRALGALETLQTQLAAGPESKAQRTEMVDICVERLQHLQEVVEQSILGVETHDPKPYVPLPRGASARAAAKALKDDPGF